MNNAIVIARIDLDRYELSTIHDLVVMGIVTVSEASESRAFNEMTEYQRVLWIRSIQAEVRGAA